MIVQAVDISKAYAGRPVLRHLSLAVNEGDRIAVIGLNGCGKTTLLHILLGREEPDQGAVQWSKNKRYAYLPQFGHMDAREKAVDFIAARLSRFAPVTGQDLDRYVEEELYDLDARIKRVCSGLGLTQRDQEKPYNTLSRGQQRRVLFALTLLKDADLLVLDEPTNHLDLAAITWLEKELPNMVKGAKACIFVAHDKHVINAVANKVLLIQANQAFLFKGNYDDFMQQWQIQQVSRERERRKQDDEVRKLREFIRRNKAGQNTKQAQSREKRLKKLQVRTLVKAPASFPIHIQPCGRNPKLVLHVENYCLAFAEPLLKKVSLSLLARDKLAIIGANGSGKTSLLNAVVRAFDHPMDGIKTAGNIPYFHMRQESEQGVSETLFQLVADSQPVASKKENMDVLGRYGFSHMAQQPYSSMSGGEKRRFQFLQMALRPFQLLLLDEPTNHLDVFTIEHLAAALKQYNGACIFITHNRFLLNRVATHIAEIRDKRLHVFHGTYAEFSRKKEQADIPSGSSKERQAISSEENKPTGLSKNRLQQLRKRQHQLEDRLMQNEQERDHILYTLFPDPQVMRSKEKAREARKRYRAIEVENTRILEDLEAIMRLLEM